MVFDEDTIIIVMNTVGFSATVYNDTDQKIKQICKDKKAGKSGFLKWRVAREVWPGTGGKEERVVIGVRHYSPATCHSFLSLQQGDHE
jgi:hypothetical protein